MKRFVLKPGKPWLTEEATVVAGGLSEPRRTFVADDGRSMSPIGASHQIKVFLARGQALRTIGRPGGPQLGRYDERHMSHPCGMAVDGQGRLWVAEAETYPKRLSQWRASDGPFLRALVRPAEVRRWRGDRRS